MKPSIPKGTRDFSPIEMVRRNYIFDTIRAIYQLYGYMPIETPSMENLETLMGKYGEEGDKLIFKILPRGNKLDRTIAGITRWTNGVEENFGYKIEEIEKIKQILQSSCDEALRYDLTVPFARYVVQHQNEITLPFKRYQIQPVWRADRPQRGRYREFYQCDADVVGSNSLLNEVELVQIIDDVFNKLNLNVIIKLNNRKILSGIAEVVGVPEKIVDITVAIDKLDKIGIDKVNEELKEKGLSEGAILQLKPLIEFEGAYVEKIELLRRMLASSSVGLKGIEEIEYIFNYLTKLGVTKLELDITLARGLNYYTGVIIEVKANEGEFTSSICGGGRYDDLTSIFGLPNVSGVGVSFGADRIYDVLSELNKFPESAVISTEVLFVNFGPLEENYCLPIVKKLRTDGINSEIYPEAAKMKKQLNYADAKAIKYVVLVGSEEMNSGVLTVKNMKTGVQEQVEVKEISNWIRK